MELKPKFSIIRRKSMVDKEMYELTWTKGTKQASALASLACNWKQLCLIARCVKENLEEK